MRLPLYTKYKDFKYKQFDLNDCIKLQNCIPKRDFYESTLVQLLENPDTLETAIIVYKFNEPQHNSLYIANTSFTSFFSGSSYAWLVLTGDVDDFSKHFLGMITEKEFILVDLRYFDRI